MSSEVFANSGIPIRDNMVSTAVSFLNNPNVQRCTIESKERFLRSKGLTDPEIQKALEKFAEGLDLTSMNVTSELLMVHKRSFLRDHVVPLIVYGGIAYSCYWFYKNCIRHLLFVEQPKRKSTADCIDELRKSLDVLNANVTSLRGEMQSNAQQSAVRSQVNDLKADIASVKGILLNRNQFPSLKARTEPVSIPSWQMQAGAEEHRTRPSRSESGGSNSSEEQAAKNSDSSLEIMEKEELPDKPREPMSAYNLWFNSERENIMARLPNLNDTELNKFGAEIWKSTDKKVWEEKAAAALQDYEGEMQLYNAAVKRKAFVTPRPKRPASAYLMWLDAARPSIKSANPGLKVTEFANKAGELWKSMPEEAKREWQDKAAKAKEQYNKELALYEANYGDTA